MNKNIASEIQTDIFNLINHYVTHPLCSLNPIGRGYMAEIKLRSSRLRNEINAYIDSITTHALVYMDGKQARVEKDFADFRKTGELK